jgi:CheY-like chemotaxis protein/DNA-binding MarR family transcriptional regulator
MANSHPTVLLVEDDDDVRAALAEELRHYDFDVREAGSGEDALRLISESILPDMLVTDIRLPGINGMDFILAIRQRPETAHLPCIIMTGYGSKRSAVEAMKLGAVDFLDKPVEVADLVLTLERVASPPPTLVNQTPAASAFRKRREIRRMFSNREEMDASFGSGLFGDHLWEILVEILASELTDEPISVTGAAAASGAAHATAMRGVEALEREGLIERRPDVKDRRRVWLSLTLKARRGFRDFLRMRAATLREEFAEQLTYCQWVLEREGGAAKAAPEQAS